MNLPESYNAKSENQNEYVAPSTPTERILATIVAEVIGIDTIGVKNDFFDLGGHSLMVTQVISRIYTDLGVNLEMKTLFEVSTVAELALLIDFIRKQNQ